MAAPPGSLPPVSGPPPGALPPGVPRPAVPPGVPRMDLGVSMVAHLHVISVHFAHKKCPTLAPYLVLV